MEQQTYLAWAAFIVGLGAATAYLRDLAPAVAAARATGLPSGRSFWQVWATMACIALLVLWPFLAAYHLEYGRRMTLLTTLLACGASAVLAWLVSLLALLAIDVGVSGYGPDDPRIMSAMSQSRIVLTTASVAATILAYALLNESFRESLP